MWHRIKSFFRSGETVNLTQDPSTFREWLSLESTSGARVDATRVLGIPPVLKGIRLIADAVSSTPIHCYRKTPEGRAVADMHPGHWLLNEEPSPFYGAQDLLNTLTFHAILYGSGYAWIRRNEFGRPDELLILPPEATYPEYDTDTLVYHTHLEGKRFIVSADDMLHIKGLSYDGVQCYSLLDIMRNAFGYGISLQSHAEYWYKNNGRPSIIIELPHGRNDADQIEEFKAAWAAWHRGVGNSNLPAIVKSGTKVTPFGNTNTDGQFHESQEHFLIMVANILCLPPYKIGAKLSSSYSSFESESKAFLKDSINPWLVKWESACNQRLRTERQRYSGSHYFEFERKALISIDAQVEKDIITAYFDAGLLAFEEARELLNRTTDTEGLTFKGAGAQQAPPSPTAAPEAQPEATEAPPEESPSDSPTEATEGNQGRDNQALAALTQATIKRGITRVAKAAQAALDKNELAGFLAEGIHKHREVIASSLQPVYQDRARGIVASYLDSLRDELASVLPEQVADVLERHQKEAPGEIWTHNNI